FRHHHSRHEKAPQSSYDEPQTGDHAAARITEKALADFTSQEAQTVRLFWRLIARYAGDIALTYFAQGGVTLAGGILRLIAP
ncbi:MAG: glucokinase, partial [Beijerinckiaceae bacterium]|nr:glucokinase [Beijerinckiaceae bacterium]